MAELKRVASPGLGTIYDQAEIDAVTKILNECIETSRPLGIVTPEVDEFERRIAEYCGAKHAIAVTSCATGLDVATMALELQPGDEVLTTSVTYQATAVCVLKEGGRPIPVEIDPKTMLLDLYDLESKITSKTRAIYGMDYGGRACDLDRIKEIAQKHNLAIVDDAAHAIGTVYKGRRVGNDDHASVFSFQSGKNITTLGEGGAIVTNDDKLAEKCKLLKSFGLTMRKGFEGYPYPINSITKDIVYVTSNYRMNPFQAAVGCTQLDKIDWMLEKRIAYAQMLKERLSKIKGITLMDDARPGDKITYHLFPILFEYKDVGVSRDIFNKALMQEFNVVPNLHYPLWYRYSIFQDRGYKWCQCPVTEEVVDHKLITLPIHTKFGEAEADFVADALTRCIDKFTKL